eukprot:GEMP01002870.1.p1 GENE.GEMP01002870.1~~GEMP01002870.1.p1  ORF type:complete len:1162 (+),score=235.10 GEMP01002870.1:50-3487(+)
MPPRGTTATPRGTTGTPKGATATPKGATATPKGATKKKKKESSNTIVHHYCFIRPFLARAFFAFLRNRERIRLNREEGKAGEAAYEGVEGIGLLSKERTLLHYKTRRITNVYRRHDATSEAFTRLIAEYTDEYREAHPEVDEERVLGYAIFTLATWRSFGTPVFAKECGFLSKWDKDEKERIREILLTYRELEELPRVLTRAYKPGQIMNRQISKETISWRDFDGTCDARLGDLWNIVFDIVKVARANYSWKEVAYFLTQARFYGEGIGKNRAPGFQCKELVQDLLDMRVFGGRDGVLDLNTWCAVGPGAKRGCNWVCGRLNPVADISNLSQAQAILEMKTLFDYALNDHYYHVDGARTSVCGLPPPKLELHDIQFGLCEFDKFMRHMNTNPYIKGDGSRGRLRFMKYSIERAMNAWLYDSSEFAWEVKQRELIRDQGRQETLREHQIFLDTLEKKGALMRDATKIRSTPSTPLASAVATSSTSVPVAERAPATPTPRLASTPSRKKQPAAPKAEVINQPSSVERKKTKKSAAGKQPALPALRMKVSDVIDEPPAAKREAKDEKEEEEKEEEAKEKEEGSAAKRVKTNGAVGKIGVIGGIDAVRNNDAVSAAKRIQLEEKTGHSASASSIANESCIIAAPVPTARLHPETEEPAASAASARINDTNAQWYNDAISMAENSKYSDQWWGSKNNEWNSKQEQSGGSWNSRGTWQKSTSADDARGGHRRDEGYHDDEQWRRNQRWNQGREDYNDRFAGDHRRRRDRDGNFYDDGREGKDWEDDRRLKRARDEEAQRLERETKAADQAAREEAEKKAKKARLERLERSIKLYPVSRFLEWKNIPREQCFGHVTGWLPENDELMQMNVGSVAPHIQCAGRHTLAIGGLCSLRNANGIYTWYSNYRLNGCSTWWSLDYRYCLCFRQDGKTLVLVAARDLKRYRGDKKDKRLEILMWDEETKGYVENFSPGANGFNGFALSNFRSDKTMNGSYVFNPDEACGNIPSAWWNCNRAHFMYSHFNHRSKTWEYTVTRQKFWPNVCRGETGGYLHRGDSGQWLELENSSDPKWVNTSGSIIDAQENTPADLVKIKEDVDGFALVDAFIKSQILLQKHKKVPTHRSRREVRDLEPSSSSARPTEYTASFQAAHDGFI